MWRRRQSRLSPQRPSSFVLRPASCVHLRWHILHLSCSLVSPSMLANPLPASLMSWCCSALLDIVSWCLLLGNCQLLLPLAACVELPVPLHLAIDSRAPVYLHMSTSWPPSITWSPNVLMHGYAIVAAPWTRQPLALILNYSLISPTSIHISLSFSAVLLVCLLVAINLC